MALLRVVDRDGVEHEVDAKPGLKVMETLRELDYGVAAICGGMCSCATCHVYVDPEWVSKLPAAMSDALLAVPSTRGKLWLMRLMTSSNSRRRSATTAMSTRAYGSASVRSSRVCG